MHLVVRPARASAISFLARSLNCAWRASSDCKHTKNVIRSASIGVFHQIRFRKQNGNHNEQANHLNDCNDCNEKVIGTHEKLKITKTKFQNEKKKKTTFQKTFKENCVMMKQPWKREQTFGWLAGAFCTLTPFRTGGVSGVAFTDSSRASFLVASSSCRAFSFSLSWRDNSC